MTPSRRIQAWRLVLPLLLVLPGCNRQDPAPLPTPRPSADDGERIDRLRSLGYLDTTGLPRQRAGRGAHVLDENAAFPGYVLVVYAGACTAELITLRGEVIRSWTDQPCHRWEHAELLPDGDLVVVGARFDEDKVPDPIVSGRYVLRLSWSGKIVWRSEINAHHDISVTPDGLLLTLVLNRRRIPQIDPANDVADDVITLLSQDGKVVESASLFDILSSSKVPFTFQKVGGKLHGGGRLIDLFHTNAVRWTTGGSILLTVRHQDEIMTVDWRTRQLRWHGGRTVLSGPHDASLLGDGRILVFDNGLSRGWSRVVEVDPRDPARLVQFAPGPAKFFNRVMGSCQRLPNGNTLIVNSEAGAAFELTPQGKPAWTYEGTRQTEDGHRVKIIRMRKLPADMIETILESQGLAKR